MVTRDHPYLPNFLLVGAVKSGSTSLYFWLKQHPEIFMSPVKEPCYFLPNHSYYLRLKQHPEIFYFLPGRGYDNWGDYVNLFSNAVDKKAIGEASVDYLYCPESPQRILDELGRVRILISLRNPVDRAYSLYLMMVREGYELMDTFENALTVEELRFNSKEFQEKCTFYFPDYLYFRSGLYYQQVKRYIDTFGKDRVMIILFDDMVSNPIHTYKHICRFLQVDDSFTPDLGHYHKAAYPHSLRLQRFLRNKFLRDPFSHHLLSVNFRERIRDALITLNAARDAPPMSKSTREMLISKYKSDICCLSELICKDLTHWVS